MLRRLSILLTTGAMVLAIGAAPALAGPKAGSVQATSTCSDLQDNTISGEIYVFLHDPGADGWDVSVTYHKTGATVWSTLDLITCTAFPGWYLYDTGLTATTLGAASVAVFDPTGTKVGGDSFLSV
jgi:hypothetical protein